jgi:hypothetical protein
MYHNFSFVENDNTHLLRWNPTSAYFGKKERVLFQPLDGPPIVHYQDTTEILGSFIWENVPVEKGFQYNQIASLVGKTGYIYTNLMPQLVGAKNLLYNSHLGDVLTGDTWEVGCAGTYHEDSSVLGPDGIRLAYLNKTNSASTNAGCYVPTTPSGPFAEHNVLSCYVKYGGSQRVGINLYQSTSPSLSHNAFFTFSSGGAVLSKYTSSAIDAYGFYKIPNSDGWFRIWLYVGQAGRNIIGNATIPYLYPNYTWSAPTVQGTYMTDIQYEQGRTSPSWFANTTGAPIDEPLQVEFLDMQTDYLAKPGVVKHNLILNFKLIGAWV